MLPRPMRAPIALLAALGLLVAMTAIPVTADAHDECDVEGESTGEVADGVTITYDSVFLCTDAPASGTWFVDLSVSNDGASTTSVTITDVVLSHTSPSPDGEAPAATAEVEGDLPTVEPGATASLRIAGDYELATTDDGDKATLHLRLSGTTGADEFFALGASVQLLATGVEPDVDVEEEIDGENGAAVGRPEWVPGPPPWVLAFLEALFANGFFGDDFPPGLGDGDGDGDADGGVADEARPDWVPGPPPWVPGPPDEEDEGAGAGPPIGIPAPPVPPAAPGRP